MSAYLPTACADLMESPAVDDARIVDSHEYGRDVIEIVVQDADALPAEAVAVCGRQGLRVADVSPVSESITAVVY